MAATAVCASYHMGCDSFVHMGCDSFVHTGRDSFNVTPCCVLQCVVVCCNVLQCLQAQHDLPVEDRRSIATRRSTLQHCATRCNTLHHSAAQCNTLQHTASRKRRQHLSTLDTDLKTLQHAATRCNTLHQTATHLPAEDGGSIPALLTQIKITPRRRRAIARARMPCTP